MLKPEKYVGSLVLRRYRLDAVISSGGMGILYRATHIRTGRQVALKFLLDRDDNGRFELEARAAAELKHPNVVDVLDMDEDEDGVAFLALELLEGNSLANVLQEQPRLSPEQLLAWLLPIMGALALAHDRGILHRDLKPANIFIANSGGGRTVPKLLDFGVAKVQSQPTLTRSGSVVGTPSYMSPEQARGERDLLAASDVWGMGVIWFRCLTGRLPFEHEAVIGTLMRIVNERAPRVETLVGDVPRALGWAIDRALQHDASARYLDMRMFARALLAAALRENIALPSAPDPLGLPDWSMWLTEETRTASTGAVPKAPVSLKLVPSLPPPLPSAPPLSSALPASSEAVSEVSSLTELAPRQPAQAVKTFATEVAPNHRRSRRRLWLVATLAFISFVAGLFVVLGAVRGPEAEPRAPKLERNAARKPAELRLLPEAAPTELQPSDAPPALKAADSKPAASQPGDVKASTAKEPVLAGQPTGAPQNADKPVLKAADDAKARANRRKRREPAPNTEPKPAPSTPAKAQDDWSIETDWR